MCLTCFILKNMITNYLLFVIKKNAWGLEYCALVCFWSH